jgi:tRNA nucleotidyltransferase/poly(A) polymerase
VNGLFYDPLTEKIHDWVGGEKDLCAKIIRTIGNPEERFGEDHLRLLRAVRFAAQLNFEIESKTFAAIQRLAPKIKLISAERVRDELIKLFAPPAGFFSLSSLKGGEGRGEEVNASENKIPSRQPSPRLGGAREKSGRAGNPLPAAHMQTDAGAHGVTRPASQAARGLILLRDSGLLEHILPELAATIDCEQSPDFHPEGSVFNHICSMLEKMPARPSLKGSFGAASMIDSLPWAVLLHDIAKPVTAEHDTTTGKIHFYGHEKVGADMAENILQRLRFPKKQTEEIVAAVRHHMQFKDVKQMRKATLRRLLMRETFPLELELHRLDCLGSFGGLEHYNFLLEQAEQLKRKPEIKPPLLTGKDLIAMGMKPGPAMGKLLDEIREKQLADELKNSRQAKAWVKRMLAK